MLKSVLDGKKSSYDGFMDFISSLPKDKKEYAKSMLKNGLFKTFANILGAGGMYDNFINEINRRL